MKEAGQGTSKHFRYQSLPTGKVLYDTLENLFFLEHEVKNLFVTKPNFDKCTEADEIYRRMLKVKLPEDE